MNDMERSTEVPLPIITRSLGILQAGLDVERELLGELE
jgi:hypothetical protein